MDTLATVIQDEVQQVHRVLLKNYITALSVDRKRVKYINKYSN